MAGFERNRLFNSLTPSLATLGGAILCPAFEMCGPIPARLQVIPFRRLIPAFK